MNQSNLKSNFTSLSALSNMPQMRITLNGWQVPITLERITQDIVEGDKVETKELISFQGVVQPLKDEALQFKPEGLRNWEWLWIHAQSGSLNLNTNDKIIFNNKRYKVMSIKDYSLNGFIEYELVRDYEQIN